MPNPNNEKIIDNAANDSDGISIDEKTDMSDWHTSLRNT